MFVLPDPCDLVLILAASIFLTEYFTVGGGLSHRFKNLSAKQLVGS